MVTVDEATRLMTENSQLVKEFSSRWGYNCFISKAHAFISTDASLWLINFSEARYAIKHRIIVVLRHHNFIHTKINLISNKTWRDFNNYHVQKTFQHLDKVLDYVHHHDVSRTIENTSWRNMPEMTKEQKIHKRHARNRALRRSQKNVLNILEQLEKQNRKE